MRRIAWLANFDGSFRADEAYLTPTLYADGWPAWIKQCGVLDWAKGLDAVLWHGAFGWRQVPVVCGRQWDGSPALVNPYGPEEHGAVLMTFAAGMKILRDALPGVEQIVYMGLPASLVKPAVYCEPIIRAKCSVAIDVFGNAKPSDNSRAVIDYLADRTKVYLENHTDHPDHYPKLPRISNEATAALVRPGGFLSATENIVWNRNGGPAATQAWAARDWSVAAQHEWLRPQVAN